MTRLTPITERRPSEVRAVAGAERPAPTDGDAAREVDWTRWMRGLGRYTRRVREFLGLSQEQVARLAGVSQGAISRLEAGRGLATPMVVVLKIHGALREAVSSFDPALLSDDARALLDSSKGFAPRLDLGDVRLARDAYLEELLQICNHLPERQRQRLLSVVRATAAALVP